MGQLEGDKAKERQTPKVAQGIRNRGHTAFQEQCKAEKVEGKNTDRVTGLTFLTPESNGKEVVIPDPTRGNICVTHS